ncbi:asparagine synthetase domain-containing protein 1 [Nephila pilipes]|uniref:Asparagine synthetase domain-containing protein 1 n=1 Tax=Nephila pilipes TaxID=299642 RepID=A0A8X6P8X4_NEPPI|nr:asparagine synthetase domain-containing protein 1 [Nephila pilipes]
MCGICVSLCFRDHSTANSSSSDAVLQNLLTRLKRRGPNYFQDISFSFHEVLDLQLTCSVLQLRGSSPSLQPLTDDSGNYLLWNGEIFDGPMFEESQSDAKVLSEKLFNCTDVTDVLPIIASIKGPFAFVFYQNNGLLWFGRDIFGRRSLLWKADSASFNLCSISNSGEWDELCTEGIYCVDLSQSIKKKSFVINLYPWSSTPSGLILPRQDEEIILPNIEMSVKCKMSLQSPISTPLNKSLPSDEELKIFQFPEVHYKNDKCFEDLFPRLLDISIMNETVSQFEEVFSKAVGKRALIHQHICKNCFPLKNDTHENFACGHTSVGILFSGGLDSIVVACLADRYLLENEPIDLINVAFASDASLKNAKALDRHTVFDTPDRITGRNGAMALRRVCPKRTWNFVEVNVTEMDLINERRNVICHLLSPSFTVLDDSIGCAIWFASRGKGFIVSDEGYKNYTSPARVLLVGMGADEQLGGYSRHRAKFNSFGWKGLTEELSLELERICNRNLGRDDRIIADNGVESRYPFLDEDVVSFLNNLPTWLKMNLNFPRGYGEKLLLRLLAFKLGLIEAAALPKRAIQFGSRIARIEDSKENGSDVCKRLKIQYDNDVNKI